MNTKHILNIRVFDGMKDETVTTYNCCCGFFTFQVEDVNKNIVRNPKLDDVHKNIIEENKYEG